MVYDQQNHKFYITVLLGDEDASEDNSEIMIPANQLFWYLIFKRRRVVSGLEISVNATDSLFRLHDNNSNLDFNINVADGVDADVLDQIYARYTESEFLNHVVQTVDQIQVRFNSSHNLVIEVASTHAPMQALPDNNSEKMPYIPLIIFTGPDEYASTIANNPTLKYRTQNDTSGQERKQFCPMDKDWAVAPLCYDTVPANDGSGDCNIVLGTIEIPEEGVPVIIVHNYVFPAVNPANNIVNNIEVGPANNVSSTTLQDRITESLDRADKRELVNTVANVTTALSHLFKG